MKSMSLSSSSSTMPNYHKASTFDELCMQQSLHFLGSLKFLLKMRVLMSEQSMELKNLQTQLYSAADYFESSYANEEQKKIEISTLKDYVLKALVNSIDHLGSVSDKVNGLLDKTIEEIRASELQIVCLEQGLCSCQSYIDHEGLSQQLLTRTPPKYHKRYILPVGETIHECDKHAIQKYQVSTPNKEYAEHQQHLIMAGATNDGKQPSFRKKPSFFPSQRARSSSPSQKWFAPSHSLQPVRFAFTEHRSASQLQTKANALLRSSSVSFRRDNRSLSNIVQLAERNNSKEIEQNHTKSKSILKSFLSRRRSRKDEMLYSSYLDEY